MKDMDSEEIYNKVVEEYLRTGSVKQTMESVGTTLVRTQRILITEGLWSSNTSEKIGNLFSQGKTVSQIAEELFLSEKTVQAYLPYTKTKKGYGGSHKSNDAIRSEEYRQRMTQAAENQITSDNAKEELRRWREEHSYEMNSKNDIPYEDITMISTDELKKKRDELDQEILAKTETGRELTAKQLYEEHMSKAPDVFRLHLELDLKQMDEAEMSVLKKYSKVNTGVTRDILVPADMTLHALHYAIQRAFGWQNSHLHQFLLPGETFQKMTGGKNERDQYGVLNYDGRFLDWVDLCGIFFRYPCDDFEDIYWDDDYKEGQSVKSWMKRKYIGPYHYAGNWEHYRLANGAAKQIAKANPMMRVNLPFHEWLELKDKGLLTEENKVRNIPIDQVTIDEAGRGFEGRLDELLERLTLRELVFPVGITPSETLLEDIKELAKRQKKHVDELSVFPVTDTLFYGYDFGDDWKVKITVTECYYTKDSFDTASEGHMDGYILEASDKSFMETVKAYDRNNQPQNEELTEKIATVSYKKKPVCLFLDGLCLMDDVGGVYGYVDFLKKIKSDDPEERESMLNWAKWMGWTGRMPKAENLL